MPSRRDLLDEEGRVRTVFPLVVDHVDEVGPEDIVPEYEHEVVVNVRFRLQDRVRETLARNGART